MSLIFLPRAPGLTAVWLIFATLALFFLVRICLVRIWREGARARVLAAVLPAARENAARHLLPLAEAALRARRCLERARDPLEPEASGLDPGLVDLLRLVRGMRGLPAAGGALWLAGTQGEIAAVRLWTALETRLDDLLGASDLARAVADGAAEEERSRVRVRVRRWLRGEPGPEAELWLLDAFGVVLLSEVRTLDRLRDGEARAPRRERQELRARLAGIPSGLPDGEAVAEALAAYLSWKGSLDSHGI